MTSPRPALPDSLCAAVLAGGRSRRFGSDKALALFRGEPLLGRTLRLLRPLCAQLAVVAKEPGPYAPLAAQHGAALLEDLTPLESPLSGLAAALRWAPAGRLFVCAADMPFVADPVLLDALGAALDDRADAALVEQGGSLQTLAALWRPGTCAQHARALLEGREQGAHVPRPGKAPGPRALLDRVRVAVVAWPAGLGNPFVDADTPEALARVERGSPGDG